MRPTPTSPDYAIAEIRAHLESLADPEYKAFNAKLIPNVAADTMIGIRVPVLRAFAKELRRGDGRVLEKFLADLPHRYFEENMLHAILIGEVCASVEEVIAELTRFLPYADNWAVTDTIRIRALRRADADVRLWLDQLARWARDTHTYTIRYSVVALMADFLDDRFDAMQLQLVETIQSDEYYVNMARGLVFRDRAGQTVGEHAAAAGGATAGPVDAQQDDPEGLRILSGVVGTQGVTAIDAHQWRVRAFSYTGMTTTSSARLRRSLSGVEIHSPA